MSGLVAWKQPGAMFLWLVRWGYCRKGSDEDSLQILWAIVVAMRKGGFRVSKRLLDEFQEGIEIINQGRYPCFLSRSLNE